MATLPRINHDELPLVSKYMRAGYVGYKGKLNATANQTLAKFPGSEFVQVIMDRRDAKGNVYASDEQQIIILDSGWRGSTSGGGTSGGGSANAAANAMAKQFTGGGQGLGLGATENRSFQAAIEGAFTGLNLAAADYKLPAGKSPDALNVDGIAVDGSVGPRPGLVLVFPRRYDSIVGTGGPTGATYKGRSVNMLSPSFWQSGYATGVVTYDKGSLTIASTASTMQTQFRHSYPAWNPQFPIDGTKPRLTISAAGGTVTVGIAMPERFRARTVASQGNLLASVDRLVVRVSTITYPSDRDGSEAFSLVAAGSTVLRDYTTWDGTSTTVTEAGQTVGQTRFYTVWGVNKEGVTKPARISVVVA